MTQLVDPREAVRVDEQIVEAVATIDAALKGLDFGARARRFSEIADHFRHLAPVPGPGDRMRADAPPPDRVTMFSPMEGIGPPDSTSADDLDPGSIIVW